MGSIVMVGEKDKEAYEIVESLGGVLRETGEILEKGAWKDLGEWTSQMLKSTAGDVGGMIEKVRFVPYLMAQLKLLMESDINSCR